MLIFDYQISFVSNAEFSDAVAELLHYLWERVWLMGQSLGDVVAQVIAVRRPDVVEILFLSNTCSLSEAMSEEGRQNLIALILHSVVTSSIGVLVRLEQYADLVTEFAKNYTQP